MPHRRGGKPMPNSCTSVPESFATTKCPNSWNRMITARTMIKSTIVENIGDKTATYFACCAKFTYLRSEYFLFFLCAQLLYFFVVFLNKFLECLALAKFFIFGYFSGFFLCVNIFQFFLAYPPDCNARFLYFFT